MSDIIADGFIDLTDDKPVVGKSDLIQLIKDFRGCKVDVGDTFGIAYGEFKACCIQADTLLAQLEESGDE